MLQTLNQSSEFTLKNISSVIWDFDGVHLEKNILPDGTFDSLCDASVAKIASLELNLDYATSLTIARESIKKYDEYLTGYINYTKNKGLPDLSPRDMDKLHDAIYRDIFYNINKNYTALLCRKEGKVIAAFDKIKDKVQHGIVSHASSSAWCKPAVAILGMHPYFNEKAVLGFEDYAYENKAKSNRGLGSCIDILGAKTEQTACVDRRLENLKSAKAGFPDIVTVWRVSAAANGTSVPTAPPYVDVMIAQPMDLLENLSR